MPPPEFDPGEKAESNSTRESFWYSMKIPNSAHSLPLTVDNGLQKAAVYNHLNENAVLA